MTRRIVEAYHRLPPAALGTPWRSNSSAIPCRLMSFARNPRMRHDQITQDRKVDERRRRHASTTTDVPQRKRPTCGGDRGPSEGRARSPQTSTAPIRGQSRLQLYAGHLPGASLPSRAAGPAKILGVQAPAATTSTNPIPVRRGDRSAVGRVESAPQALFHPPRCGRVFRGRRGGIGAVSAGGWGSRCALTHRGTLSSHRTTRVSETGA